MNIAASELRVEQSRRGLYSNLRRLRRRLSRPSSLAAAASAGALIGFALTREGGTRTLSALVAALVRRAAAHVFDTVRRSRGR